MAPLRIRFFAGTFLVIGTLIVASCASSAPTGGSAEPEPQYVVPQFIQQARTASSWNRNVRCRATVTTLRRILGTQRGSRGGATFQGGGFKPGIPDRRALRPPCRVSRVPTFVQLNHARVGACRQINNDGDWTCTLTDPRLSGPEDMRRIHIETDRRFRRRSGWSIPPGGTDIRVQGFVFWDPGHTNAAFHNHSGWEIHSFTAWRRA